MQLITDIIVSLTSETSNLENALIKTKLLLHRLGDSSSQEWIDKELCGYNIEDDVPRYRIVHSRPILTVSNGVRIWNNITPSLSHLPEDAQRYFDESSIRDSISGLEFLCTGESNTLSTSITPEYWHYLRNELSENIHIEYASCEVVKSQVLQIRTTIRSRLLDFVLALEERIPNGIEWEEAAKMSKQIDLNNLFNNTMFGNNTTVIVGSDNHTNVSNNIKQNDLESLKEFLCRNGITRDDVNLLEKSIKQDANDSKQESNQLGESVDSWRKEMLKKAIDGAWQIEVGVASSLLATALNTYYGIF